MKKLLISATYLKDGGGIDTATINLLREIHNQYDVTLCLPCSFVDPKYDIPDNIKVVYGSTYLRDVIVDRVYLSYQNLFQQLLRNIRRVLNHYVLKRWGIEYALKRIRVDGEFDVAIAFADYKYSAKDNRCFDYYIVLNKVKALRKVAWIHNNPERLGWTHELALREFAPFDAVVNVSKDCKRILDGIIPEYEYKSKVVYNMYDIATIKRRGDVDKKLYADNGKLHLVTVARIHPQKRIDRVIEVCRRLKDDGHENFDWTVVGTGNDLNRFKEQIVELCLQDTVRFVGLQPNPYPYMKQADALCLVSEYEGLSIVIKEAHILGTPTFITNFGAAPETTLVGKQGEICENSTEGVYQMILGLITNPDKLVNYRRYLSEHHVNNAIAHRQFDEIMS